MGSLLRYGGSIEPLDRESMAGPGVHVPTNYWREFRREAAGVRLLGSETADRVPLTIEVFVEPEFPPWFRIWVGLPTGWCGPRDARRRPYHGPQPLT